MTDTNETQNLMREFIMRNKGIIADFLWEAINGKTEGSFKDLVASVHRGTGKTGRELAIHTLLISLSLSDTEEAVNYLCTRLEELLED